MLIQKSVKEYLAESASSSPAPGGGSASALAGAIGASLAEMVINLTVGKKKYVEVTQELSALLPILAKLRSELEASIDKDSEAFNQVMAAFGLPKETEEQQTIRKAAIRDATLKATEVPLNVMETALQALEVTLTVAEKGNVNSASDAGVAGLLLVAAIDGAALNVRINLSGLANHPFAEHAAQRLREINKKRDELFAAIQTDVAKNIS
ncbi:MAG: cyclodeaminase/cyclohydrolase family protein [bacterium]